LKKTVSQIILTLLLTSILASAFNTEQDMSEPEMTVVPDEYPTIQAAINAANAGDTIYIGARVYYEKVLVNKSVSLVGENRDTTIIDGNRTGTVIRISANNVSIINLTIRNAGRNWGPPPGYGYPDSCVDVRNVRNVRIENNTLTGAAVCLAFTDSTSFTNVTNNVVCDATYIGILGYYSHDISICHNLVSDYGFEGIHLDGGSSYCKVICNTVKNGLDGISLEKSATANNLVDGNILLNNNASIGLYACGKNVFRRNNITNSQYNLLVWGYDLTNFMQDIDDSNIANSKVLYYLTNRSNLLIEPYNYPDLGYIALVNCTNIMVRGFNLTSNGDGVLLARSTNCTLMNITLSSNRGPLIYGGLMFFKSNNNTVVSSEICNNSYGVCLYYSDWNIFYHNSFANNYRHVVPDFQSPFMNTSSGYFSASVWDDGFEGNYWGDYTGEDENKDGIGDTLYVVSSAPSNQYDHYPLMGMFHSFDVSYIVPNCRVTVVSNSTISDFNVLVWIEHPEVRLIEFNVAGESGVGFCRICIPHELMSPPYIVIIDNGQTSVLHYNGTVFNNGTHTWIYFTYQHSKHQITIVPEFPSFTILPLFMILSMLAVVFTRQRFSRKLKTYL